MRSPCAPSIDAARSACSRRSSRCSASTCSWALLVALICWRLWLVFGGASGGRLYTPDTHSDPILIGCFAGLLYSFGRTTRVPRAVAYLCLGTSVTIIATLVEVNSIHHMFGRSLFATAVATILLSVTLDCPWWFTRLMTVRPLRGLGTISYGLYLWHFPIFFALGWEFGLPLSIAVALVSYRFVELPFLRRKHEHRARHPHWLPMPRSPPLAALRLGQRARHCWDHRHRIPRRRHSG